MPSQPRSWPLRAIWALDRTPAATAVVLALAPFIALALVPLAVVVRLRIAIRRLAGLPPRVAWGPTPILNIVHWSRALRTQGFESFTAVSVVYPANDPDEFDDRRADAWPPMRRLERLKAYAQFARVVRRAEIVSCFFDGGFLLGTPLERLEWPLLRVAGIRAVAVPCGSDVAVPGYLGDTEAAFASEYPVVYARGKRTQRRVDRICRYADLVIATMQIGYLPRRDALWTSATAVDIPPAASPPPGDEVVVLHAPNHRALKGTDEIVAAVEELRAEGVPLRLELLERRSNREVREAVERADIVADQLLAGYGLFAVEAMAAGKPVISRISWMEAQLLDTPSLRESPIVDASPATIKEVLEELAADPSRRRELGRRSREYAERHHSYEAVGRAWANIVRHVWDGRPLEPPLLDLRTDG